MTKEHELTLVLTSEPDEEQTDKMYGRFQDATIATVAGVPRIDFHRESSSLEVAIRSAIEDVRSLGFDVGRVEMLPDALPT